MSVQITHPGEYYPHQGGNIFTSVHLFVGWFVSRKLLDGFPQNLDGARVAAQNRPHYLSVQLLKKGWIQVFFLTFFNIMRGRFSIFSMIYQGTMHVYAEFSTGWLFAHVLLKVYMVLQMLAFCVCHDRYVEGDSNVVQRGGENLGVPLSDDNRRWLSRGWRISEGCPGSWA